MILTFAEDYTSNVKLDTELMGVPQSGMYFNSGVHNNITIDNLLHYLPKIDITVSAYNAATTYSKYVGSFSDIVEVSGKIYQSLSDNNLNNTPSTSPSNWLETDIDSLRLKRFIKSVEDKVISNLKLSRRLVDSQYLYNINDIVADVMLSGDYSAWVFEPKGSDYVKIRINQIGLQANTTNLVNIYVINQGQLIETLSITPNNGVLEFKDVGYEFSGFGRFIFAFDSQSVKISNGYIDPLKYEGFVAYTSTGVGSTPQGSDYSYSNMANGLNFNITAYLDSSIYIKNNLVDFASFIRTTFELEALNMFKNNSNNVSNRNQRIQMEVKDLLIETKNLEGLTVAKKWVDEKNSAIKKIKLAFDTQLTDDDSFEIEITSI